MYRPSRRGLRFSGLGSYGGKTVGRALDGRNLVDDIMWRKWADGLLDGVRGCQRKMEVMGSRAEEIADTLLVAK